MTQPVIVPQPRRASPVAVVVLVACAALLLVMALAGGVTTLAIQGKAAAARPISGTVPACPAARAERQP